MPSSDYDVEIDWDNTDLSQIDTLTQLSATNSTSASCPGAYTASVSPVKHLAVTLPPPLSPSNSPIAGPSRLSISSGVEIPRVRNSGSSRTGKRLADEALSSSSDTDGADTAVATRHKPLRSHQPSRRRRTVSPPLAASPDSNTGSVTEVEEDEVAFAIEDDPLMLRRQPQPLQQRSNDIKGKARAATRGSSLSPNIANGSPPLAGRYHRIGPAQQMPGASPRRERLLPRESTSSVVASVPDGESIAVYRNPTSHRRNDACPSAAAASPPLDPDIHSLPSSSSSESFRLQHRAKMEKKDGRVPSWADVPSSSLKPSELAAAMKATPAGRPLVSDISDTAKLEVELDRERARLRRQQQEIEELMSRSKHLSQENKALQQEIAKAKAKAEEAQTDAEASSAQAVNGPTRVDSDGEEDDHCCSICQDIYVGASSIVPCGHSFCGQCIWEYIQVVNSTCPVCRVELVAPRVIPCYTLDALVDRWATKKLEGAEKQEWLVRKDGWMAYKLSLELNDRGQSGGGVCTTRARAAPAPDRAAVAAAAPATGYLPFNLDAALYGHDPLAAMVGRSDPALAIAPGGRGGGYQRGAQQQQPAQGGWPALGGRGGNGWSGGGGGAAPAHNNPPHHRHGMFRAQDVVTWRDAAAQAEPVLRPGPGGWGQPQVAAAAAAERRSLSIQSQSPAAASALPYRQAAATRSNNNNRPDDLPIAGPSRPPRASADAVNLNGGRPSSSGSGGWASRSGNTVFAPFVPRQRENRRARPQDEVEVVDLTSD